MRFSKYKFNDNLLISIILLRVNLYIYIYILYNDNGKKYKVFFKKKKFYINTRKSQVKTLNVFTLHIKYIIYTNKLGLQDLCHGFLIGISYQQGDTNTSLIGCCVIDIKACSSPQVRFFL